MRGRTYAVALVGMALVAALWIRSCSGPEVAVMRADLLPPAAPGAPYLVDVELANRGGGEGEVTVRVQLRDPAGHLYEHQARAELTAHGTARLQVPLHAPAGSTLGDVKARYPPE